MIDITKIQGVYNDSDWQPKEIPIGNQTIDYL